MFIDTHCHLTFENYTEDLTMVIGNAKKAGVKQCIVPGVDYLSSRLSVELSATQPGSIFSAIGFHPYEAQQLPDINTLESFINDSVVAIGECGLDYHLYKDEDAAGKKTNQTRLFDEHIKLANKLDLPLTMHCRDAFDDFFATLDAQLSPPRGVIHCFSGGLQEIRMAKERGLFIGLDGNITFSKQLQMIIPDIPVEMILLETDAPYLTPVPHRGTRNEPKYIPLIARTIAELKHLSIDEIEKQTTYNAQSLFKLDTKE